KELAMKYYDGTNNIEKLFLSAQDFVNNGLYKINVDSIISEDLQKYGEFIKPFKAGEQDSINNPQYEQRRLIKYNKMVSYSYKLRDAAEALISNYSDENILDQASEW